MPKLLLMLSFLLSLDTFADNKEIRIYAASSLTDALNEISMRYKEHHADITIKAIYAGSSTLAKQIENGAPADLFISADPDWLNYLDAHQLIATESKINLLSNELVFIAPLDQKISIRFAPEFLFNNAWAGKLCTGDPASVPVGKYAQQSLSYFGWWDSVKSRLVATEDVRTALAFVERGECSLGIVYATDAKMSRKVKVIAQFPAQSHKPIIYPAALTKKSNESAREFWHYLQTQEAQSVFVHYGFTLNQ